MQLFRLTIIMLALAGLQTPAAIAGDLKVEAKLIWGTNDGVDKLKHHPVSPDLAQKLGRAFKWKNYVEITNRVASIPVNQSSEIKMSEPCVLRLKNLGSSRVEVHCIGKGK